MKKWAEIWLGMGCVAAVFLVGLVGFAPPETPGSGPVSVLEARPEYLQLPAQTVSPIPSPSNVPTVREAYVPGATGRETLRVAFGSEVQEMPLQDYVYGVVAAEMPAAFPDAALEAQAVAARTYALYQSSAGKHADIGADVCGESTCCQAFITQNELDARWGADAAFYTQKLRAAVERTAGEVLTYHGELAAAVYHASSDGSTRSATEVWGGAQPYLAAVATPEETGQKGHGVGMSQRGAQALALEGLDYRAILAHYYQGIEITRLD